MSAFDIMSLTDGEMDLNLSESYIYKLQKERYQIFKSQNLANGEFDVTFEVKGKKLHAHKEVLTSFSETLEAWLSDRWSSKGEPIKVETYSYESFYQMISFIYSGYCCLTAENIYQFIDVAEFYLVSCFKEYCDQFLSELEKSAKNIEEMYECADKYSLPSSMDSIKKYIRRNGIEIYCTENFRGYKKPFAEFLSTIYDTRVQIENNGKIISGTLLDNYGILPAFEKQKSSCSIKRRTSTKIRFLKMKFPVQLTASTVSKMVGIDWYLCFDKDGILSFKNYAAVDRSDFLIAEMKSDNEFALTPDEKTSLSAVYID